MANLIEQLQIFYQVDQYTFMVILAFCAAAAYAVRNQLTNSASALILGPLFFFVALTTYLLAQQMQMFSPRKSIEWITYTTFSAAIGAIMGIFLVAVLRLIQEKFITAAHIRQTLKRDAEQSERGYPQVDV